MNIFLIAEGLSIKSTEENTIEGNNFIDGCGSGGKVC
jgi:hypothetical protein